MSTILDIANAIEDAKKYAPVILGDKCAEMITRSREILRRIQSDRGCSVMEAVIIVLKDAADQGKGSGVLQCAFLAAAAQLIEEPKS